jgi:hypothetical protein
MSAVLTYVTGTGDPSLALQQLRAGDPVRLCPAIGGAETEAWLASGRRLGRLPPAERSMLAGLGLPPSLTARIAAVVPRFGTAEAGRVLLEVDAA